MFEGGRRLRVMLLGEQRTWVGVLRDKREVRKNKAMEKFEGKDQVLLNQEWTGSQ